jgi:hypothetical protein
MWATILALFPFLTELMKLIREVRSDAKEQNAELKKQKTETLQSTLRGIIDMDESRINSGFDKLRRLRGK